MTAPTGADQVAAALRAHHVSRVFAIPSVHNIPMLRSMRSAGIDIVGMRHEQGVVHAADAAARTTGRLGVAVVSTGPGTANAMGGLYEAAFAQSPVLLLTGQVPTRHLGTGRGSLHEAEGQDAMLRAVCGSVHRPARVSEVGRAVLAAADDALGGRPHPTAAEIPIDLQEGVLHGRAPALRPAERIRELPDPDTAAAIAELLTSARRPLLWAGGGVVRADAGPALTALAEALDVPVVTTREGRGALPETHPLSLGCFPTVTGLRELVESADAVVAVGSRMQMFSTDAWRLRMPDRLAAIDIDARHADRGYRPGLVLTADIGLALTGVLEAAGPAPDRADFLRDAHRASEAARAHIRRECGPDHMAICESIRRHLPADGMIVRDATLPAYLWADRILPVLRPRTSIRPTGAGIGPGLPFAIGSALAGERPCVLIQGDGGLMLSIGELAAAAQTGAPVVACVFNDGGYGVLRAILEDEHGAPADDVDLATPRIAEVAAGFGIPAVAVADAAGFDTEFAAALRRGGPAVIEIDMAALSPLRRNLPPEKGI